MVILIILCHFCRCFACAGPDAIMHHKPHKSTLLELGELCTQDDTAKYVGLAYETGFGRNETLVNN
jgi:hypothetical protein